MLEVSSFQLERAPQLPAAGRASSSTSPRTTSIATRASPRYADAKGNAFVNQTADDVAVVPFGDKLCEEQARRGQGRLVLRFGAGGDYVVDGQAVVESATR